MKGRPERGPPFSVAASLAPEERARYRGVVASDRVELLEHGGSGRAARFGDDGRLMARASRWVGAPLDRQEGVVKSAFGIVGFDHDEAPRG